MNLMATMLLVSGKEVLALGLSHFVALCLGYGFRGKINKELNKVGTAAKTDLTNTAKKL